jgi:fructose-bisphosphate aldolase, class I
VEMRQTYRELLLSAPGLRQYISGVIMVDETIRQANLDGKRLLQLAGDVGLVVGIKVDTGAKELAAHPREKVTEGPDGLRERLELYVQMGARFAKWRAVTVPPWRDRRQDASEQLRAIPTLG